MPHTLQEILDHSEELAQSFETYEPADVDHRPVEPLHRLRAAVQARAKAEEEIVSAVVQMREARYSWATIGSWLGTSGEAGRQRYSELVAAAALPPLMEIVEPEIHVQRTAEIRRWARSQGWEVADRGRLSAAVLEAYEVARDQLSRVG